MSKPGADPSSGTSLGDALRLPERHPACRRREAQSGSYMERENLAGDAKGKSASGSNREAEKRSVTSSGHLSSSRSAAAFSTLPSGEFSAMYSIAFQAALKS